MQKCKETYLSLYFINRRVPLLCMFVHTISTNKFTEKKPGRLQTKYTGNETWIMGNHKILEKFHGLYLCTVRFW